MERRALVTLVLAIAAGSCNRSEQKAASTAVSTQPEIPGSPASTASAATSQASDVVRTSAGDLAITPLHHATVLFEWSGKNIYVDPAADARYDGRPKADVILITDIHADHMSPPTVAMLRKEGTTIVVPPAVAPNLPKDGIITIKNGETKQVGGFGVEAVAMYNLQRGPSAGRFYHDKGRGNGYVLTFGDKRVYLSGDTECTPEMKALKDIDVAFVCMNLPYTMPPAEAAECVKAFAPKIVFPYHYRGSNLDEFKTALGDAKGIEVRVRNWYP